MPSLLTILIMVGALMFSIGLTVLIMRRTRHHDAPEVPDETLQEARALRQRVETLYTGSDDVQKRAKRLEQMLEVQRRGQR